MVQRRMSFGSSRSIPFVNEGKAWRRISASTRGRHRVIVLLYFLSGPLIAHVVLQEAYMIGVMLITLCTDRRELEFLPQAYAFIYKLPFAFISGWRRLVQSSNASDSDNALPINMHTLDMAS